MATTSDVTLERSPFQGLGFYTEADAKWFFGRLTERRIILAHLRTARLTLLYAESGVGKSSLLRAGVSARLRDLAARGGPGRSPKHIPIVFSAWKDDPVQDLISAIQGLVPGHEPPSPTGIGAARTSYGLADAITATGSALDATLVIMLDQFEEHFSYRHVAAQPDRLADELARCVNAPDVPANFLIAVREDAYGRLGDLFSGRIGNIYDNYLHLEYMSREAAREAIEGPVAMYNAEHGEEEAITVEDALTEAVLDEVRRGNLELGGRRADRDGGSRWSSANGDEIETPFLQLVMTRLWECERAQGSQVLRRATLEDELGGAEAIVRNHVGRALAGLDEPQLEIATDIFGDLVTPSGVKVAHTAVDLAQMSGQRADAVTSILDRLYEERIVRAVDPAPGTSEARYEIFHDRLAAPILDWRDRQENARLERARHDAEVEAETQRRQARRFRRRAQVTLVLVVSLLAVLAALVIALRYAHRQSTAANHEKQAALRDTAEATSFALTARAQSQLSTRPAVSLLLYLAAYHERPGPVAERNLVATLNAARLSYAIGILHGHTDAVEGIAFSPNSRTLASVSADKTVRLWQVTAGGAYPLGSPLRSGAPLYSAAFTPNGQTLASGSFDRIVLWSIQRHARESVIPFRAAAVASVAYGRGGVVLAAGGSNGRVLLLNTVTHRRRILVVGGSAPIRGIAFSPDGTLLAVGTTDAVALWKVSTGRPAGAPLTAALSTVNSVAFSRDGHTLAAGGQDGAVALWNAVTRRELGPELTGRRQVNSISFTPDGTKLVAAGEGNTVLWSVRDHRRIVALTGHQGAIYGVAVSPDGGFIASAGADRTITVWRTPIGPVLGVPILRRPAGFSAVAVSRDGEIAAGSLDGAIVLAQQDGTHQHVLTVPEPAAGGVSDVAFDPTGRLVAGAYDDGSVRLWEVATDRPLAVAISPGGPIHAIAFNRTGSLLVSGGHSGAVQLWNAHGLTRVGPVMDGGPGAVYAVAFSPDGRVVASGGNDRAIRLWNAATQRPLRPSVIPQVDAVFSLAFSPLGHLLASGDGGDAIHLWRLGNHGYAPGRTLTGDSAFVRSVAFSPDGKTLASGSTDTTVRLWDVADGTELGSPLDADTGSVESVAFRTDGRLLASASVDGTVRLWPAVTQPLSFGVLTAEVCRFLGAGLSRAEWSEYAAGISYRQTCPRSTPS